MTTPTRREYLLASVVGVAGLAGCGSTEESTETPADTETPTEPETEPPTATETETQTDEPATPEETPTQSVPDGEPVTVSGDVVDSSGNPVTAGEVISLGPPEGLVAVEPESTGQFELELTSGQQYVVQYTQGIDQYPDDGLPDLYTIETLEPVSNVDMGEITLPTAYDVAVTVETPDGTDVTEDADVTLSHVNGDAASGFELTNNPIELTGEITFTAAYDGSETTEEVTVTDATSVTIVV